MSLQEAVEAPRVWTQGQELEVETGGRRRRARRARRRAATAWCRSPHVAGGMGAIAFEADGTLTGASCWRADGTPVGLGGGYARAGIRFWPGRRHRSIPRRAESSSCAHDVL